MTAIFSFVGVVIALAALESVLNAVFFGIMAAVVWWAIIRRQERD